MKKLAIVISGLLAAAGVNVNAAETAEFPRALRTYVGDGLRRVKLPLGGIGTGTISLSGRGALVDWEIKNTPAKGYVPNSGSFGSWCPMFAVRCRKPDGTVAARLLEGPLDVSAYEGACGTTVPNHGFPRFEGNAFDATYPFARLRFTDRHFPLGCSLVAWNPMIPGDADSSGIPGAYLSYSFVNPSDAPMTVSVVGMLSNCAGGERTESVYDDDGIRGVRLCGDGGGTPSTTRGSLALAVPDGDWTVTRSANVRGPGWNVPLDRFWLRFVTNGDVVDQPDGDSAHAALVCVSFTLKPGEKRTVPFVIGWSFPDRHCWSPKGFNPWDVGPFEGRFDPADLLVNHYSLAYPDAKAAVKALFTRRDELLTKTRAFVDGFLKAKVPAVVKEAALFNLSTLRCETCFRTADGRFYGWEGIHDSMGSCYGSCNHVWGYEHCLVDLWPDLARTMLETSFGECSDERGHMTFRIGLPLERPRPIVLAAADGQFQTIVKAYEYVSKAKDDAWLRKWWPRIRRSVEFCWIEGGWDADCDGVVEGCQHNTMDVEYYGPNPQMGFLYLAALEAAAKMADACGDGDFAAKCRGLKRRGSEWIEKNLFNGEWYEHIITPPKGKIAEGLGNSGMGAKDLSDPDFQLGAGCLVDQLVGQYAAVCAGLGPVADRAHALTTLKTIMKRNRRGYPGDESFNPLRGYALAGERSIRMAWYPEGRRPRSPFPYYAETMTGFEYVVAALFAQYGDYAAAEEVVRDIRDRYDGNRRNPFDEAECGHHYARALAAWSVFKAWR